MHKTVMLITLAVLLWCSLGPALVKADGFGFIVYTDESSFALHTEETQVAAINYAGGREKLLLAVKFSEVTTNSVVWIVPVPANAADVKINILEAFPSFSGDDILLRAEHAKDTVTSIPLVVSLSQIYTLPLYMVASMADWDTMRYSGLGDGEGVEIHAHIEQEGIVTEVVTADTAEALSAYLNRKNITVPVGSIPILDEYMGKTYSFVVSWVTSIADATKMPAIFVDFPTDELYYPLKPTSVYGDAEIPVLIYVVGYAQPNPYSELEPFIECRYFTGGLHFSESLEQFYSDATPSDYTRIVIGQFMTPDGLIIGQSTTPPSALFVDDLWIENLERPPPSVERALRTVVIYDNRWYFAIGWLIGASLLAGGLTGYLIFRDFKKFALIGLTNCFTIIGIVAVTFALVKEHRAKFIGFFSIIFLLVHFLIILPIVAILIL